MNIPHGVRLEQEKKASLKNGIRPVLWEEAPAVPRPSLPLKRDAGAAQIREAADRAGIVDETDGRPLGDRLADLAQRGTGLLVAHGFDDDPYASGSQAFLRENAEKITAGFRLAAKACGAEKVLFAVASRWEEKELAERKITVPILPVSGRYPADVLLMQRLCRDGTKAAFVGVQACAALQEAVREGKPQSETVVTVAGDGAEEWGNFRVRLGTPVETVLKAAKMDDRAQFVAVGSSVTGRAVRDLTMPVTAATRCILVLKKAPPERTFPCVRCGRCARACPVGIIPWLVHRELEGGSPDTLLLFHVGECVDCRACGAVCPSGIELSAEVRRAAALKEGDDAE